MLRKETKERIADFFDASELVDILQIPAMDVIEAFEDDFEEALDDIEEIMGILEEDEEDEE